MLRFSQECVFIPRSQMQMLYLILLIFNKRGGEKFNFIPLEGPEDESKNGQKFDEVCYCLVKDCWL